LLDPSLCCPLTLPHRTFWAATIRAPPVADNLRWPLAPVLALLDTGERSKRRIKTEYLLLGPNRALSSAVALSEIS
jgi:hypothetical protein